MMNDDSLGPYYRKDDDAVGVYCYNDGCCAMTVIRVRANAKVETRLCPVCGKPAFQRWRFAYDDYRRSVEVR